MPKISERPIYIERLAQFRCNSEYIKIAETLKLTNNTKKIVFEQSEFFREFGKSALTNMKVQLKKLGIRRPRVVLDKQAQEVIIFKNDD